MLPRPGLGLTPNVRLRRLLSEGGMGSVWIAEHLTLRTDVAVKFMSEDLARDPVAMDRFSREATAAAQMKSPHVVQVFDHGTVEDTPFIVMELLEGEDLAKRIERTRRLPLPEVAEIVRQVARALTKAHALGIVHRDIKPANVFLINSEGELLVKLLDFGIAKQLTLAAPSATATGNMIGTPYYMSPETIFSSAPIDFRADLWALAVLTYEALIGGVPFYGDTTGAIHLAIHAAAFHLPTAYDRGFDPRIDAWFASAFARDPGQRFASAKAMADRLIEIAGLTPTGILRAPDLTSSLPRSSTGPAVAARGGSGVRSFPPAGAATSMPTLGGTASPLSQRGASLLGLAIGATAGTALILAVGVFVLRARRAPPRDVDGTRLGAPAAPAPRLESKADGVGAPAKAAPPIASGKAPLVISSAAPSSPPAIPIPKAQDSGR